MLALATDPVFGTSHTLNPYATVGFVLQKYIVEMTLVPLDVKIAVGVVVNDAFVIVAIFNP
jgi:hypothetical protein